MTTSTVQTVAIFVQGACLPSNPGTALLRRREPVAAAQQLEGALSLRPEHLPSCNNLAEAHCLAGLPELAAAAYREVLQRDPANVVARQSLAALTKSTAEARAPQSGAAQEQSGNASGTRGGVAVRAQVLAPPPPGAEGVPQTVPPVQEVESHAEIGVAPNDEVLAIEDLLRELPHATVERRSGQLVVSGWTSTPGQRKLLERILAGRTNVMDLTTEDIGYPHRLIEVDATIFKVIDIDSESAGHNFLRRLSVNASIADGALASFDWLYTAALSYEVNIANVSEQRIALLARPHLTASSGTAATFVAGGDMVSAWPGISPATSSPTPTELPSTSHRRCCAPGARTAARGSA